MKNCSNINEMLNIARLADTTSVLPGGSSSHLSSLAVSKGRSPVHPSLDTKIRRNGSCPRSRSGCGSNAYVERFDYEKMIDEASISLVLKRLG